MAAAALPEHFWSKVDRGAAAGCWLWTGAKNSRGYGCWAVHGRSRLTHRLAYEAMVGPIPPGLTIDHVCRVKACCNPSHLDVVTQAENNRRAHADVTHCPKGHEYTPENTIVKKGTQQRHCRECQKARQRAWNARRAVA